MLMITLPVFYHHRHHRVIQPLIIINYDNWFHRQLLMITLPVFYHHHHPRVIQPLIIINYDNVFPSWFA